MRDAFIGSDAVRSGRLSGYALRTRYRAVFPDVYLPSHLPLSLRVRAEAAWLWSGRRGVLTGVAAAALHGSAWIDDDEPVELTFPNSNPPAGIVTRNQRIEPDEVTKVACLPVTTPARTAYDLARRLPRAQALVHLDALMHATPFSNEDVLLLAKRYPGARGLRQLRTVLPLIDGASASPKETWLRLLLLDAGLPVPATQIPVVEGYWPVAFLDLGWEQFKVAAEYDGDQHRTDRRQYAKDHRRLRKLEELGWTVIRVIAEDKRDDIVRRVYGALRRRGFRGT